MKDHESRESRRGESNFVFVQPNTLKKWGIVKAIH